MDEKEPVLGRDFFWTMTSLAHFPSLVGDVHESVFLARPPYVPSNAVINAEKRERAEMQLKRLVMNDKRPFASGQLGLLLVATGWRMLKMPNKQVVYVPHWKTSSVKGNNLGNHQSGRDYFFWEDTQLIDHLEVRLFAVLFRVHAQINHFLCCFPVPSIGVWQRASPCN
jgi:hypothetical protein